MKQQNELTFLCEVFKRLQVNAILTDERGLKETLLGGLDEADEGLPKEFCAERTLYKRTDTAERCFRFLRLPQTQPVQFLCIGPFLSAPLSPQRILELGETYGVSPQQHSLLTTYYASLPVLSANCQALEMLHVFCERLWHTTAYAVQDDVEKSSPDTPFTRSMQNLAAQDTLVSVRALERRYAFENEMIRSVSLGQTHMENRFKEAFSNKFFEQRAHDPLRNAKNYAVIMNTLLRKAAEKGGVHPVYLDRLSSEFAAKIERFEALSGIPSLMSEMFRSYARLVRKHSLKKFSPIVQNSILIIDADLSADLSASTLAQGQNVSLGYLSTVFKKETGKTVSEYVRERRMEYAEYLLAGTTLQVQTISLHCGIMDAQYFSKLFKKQTGLTPNQYRAAAAKNA
jgi:YesN/AraC family two-component response regulator